MKSFIRYFLFLFILILIFVNGIGQDYSDQDSSGLKYYCSAFEIMRANPEQSSRYYFKAIPLLKKASYWEEMLKSYNGIAMNYVRISEYDSAEKFLKIALNENLEYRYKNVESISIGNLGGVYFLKDDFKKAIQAIKKGHDIYPHKEKISHLNNYYSNLSSVYRKLGDYDEALRLTIKSLKLEKLDPSIPSYSTANTYSTIARLYLSQKKYDLALINNTIADSLYEQSTITNDSYGLYFEKMIGTYRYYAIIYLGKNKPDSSFYYLKKAKALSTKAKHPGIFYKKLSIIWAEVYIKLGEKELAIQEGENYLAAIKYDHQKVSNPRAMGLAYYELAKIYFHYHEYKKAADLLLRAYAYFNGENVNSVEDIYSQEITRPFETIKLLKLFSEISYAKYQEKEKLNDLVKTFKVSLLATQSIPKVYREFQNEKSRLFMAEQAIPISELAIKAAIELHNVTKEDSFLTYAFAFTEQNKAALLYQSLKDNEYKQSIGIPDSILEKEASLNVDLAFYKMELFKEEQKGEDKNQKEFNRWKDKVFDLEQAERDLSYELKNSYPQYYQLKYQTSSLSPTEIQSKLSPNQAMIEYFRGDSATYAFVITKQSLWVKELPNHDSIQSWANRLREGSYHYWMSKDKSDQLYSQYNQQYVNYAFQLYQTLIEPLNDQENNLPEQLIFIPDDILGYLPFDALLSELPENPNHFGTHPYLLKKHQVSYAISATLWNEMSQDDISNANGNMLAVGPTFGDQENQFSSVNDMRRDGFAPLTYNQEEVKNINRIFGGELLLDKQATKSIFLEQAPSYKFIHLSTHAKANDNDSRFSRIAFTPINDTTDENNFLTLAEISNLHLKAEMVALSACETALGELKRGEGIMSLSRAFTYTGVKSVITTLWSVNDRSTAELMKGFYEKLAEGLSKDEALRHARLDFISNSDHQLAHPFFWAAAVPIGDMSPISGEQNYWIYGVGILIGLVILGLILRIGTNKRRINSKEV